MYHLHGTPRIQRSKTNKEHFQVYPTQRKHFLSVFVQMTFHVQDASSTTDPTSTNTCLQLPPIQQKGLIRENEACWFSLLRHTCQRCIHHPAGVLILHSNPLLPPPTAAAGTARWLTTFALAIRLRSLTIVLDLVQELCRPASGPFVLRSTAFTRSHAKRASLWIEGVRK